MLVIQWLVVVLGTVGDPRKVNHVLERQVAIVTQPVKHRSIVAEVFHGILLRIRKDFRSCKSGVVINWITKFFPTWCLHVALQTCVDETSNCLLDLPFLHLKASLQRSKQDGPKLWESILQSIIGILRNQVILARIPVLHQRLAGLQGWLGWFYVWLCSFDAIDIIKGCAALKNGCVIPAQRASITMCEINWCEIWIW